MSEWMEIEGTRKRRSYCDDKMETIQLLGDNGGDKMGIVDGTKFTVGNERGI